MESSYYIKGQPPESAKFEIHNAGIKYSEQDLIPDYSWLAYPTVSAQDKSVFIMACCALVAAVEALRYGLIMQKSAEHTITRAKAVIKEMEKKYGDSR